MTLGAWLNAPASHREAIGIVVLAFFVGVGVAAIFVTELGHEIDRLKSILRRFINVE